MRPILRPGTHVLTRGTGELQVGLDPRSALVLPDSAEVRRALALLAVSADRAEHADPTTLDLLVQHDLVLDESALVPALGRTDITAATSAALARTAGPEAPARRTARGDFFTDVVGFGHPAGASLPDDLADLVGAVGLPRPAPRDGLSAAVLVGVGEPDRELVDPWTRSGTRAAGAAGTDRGFPSGLAHLSHVLGPSDTMGT